MANLKNECSALLRRSERIKALAAKAPPKPVEANTGRKRVTARSKPKTEMKVAKPPAKPKAKSKAKPKKPKKTKKTTKAKTGAGVKKASPKKKAPAAVPSCSGGGEAGKCGDEDCCTPFATGARSGYMEPEEFFLDPIKETANRARSTSPAKARCG